MLKLKGSKVKKSSGGSEKDKSVKLKDVKDLQVVKPKNVVVVSMKGGAGGLAGAAFKLSMPGGKTAKGTIDGSGKISAALEQDGDSKLEFTSLTDDLKKAR